MTFPEPATSSWGNIHRVRAEVILTGGQTVAGDLHLFELAPTHSGPETPEDLLNREEAFFAITDDSGQTLILAKRHVLVVGVAAEPAAEDPDRLVAARTIELGLELSDGSEWSGSVTSELPPRRPRALDYLNHRGGFFPLHVPGAVRLINREHVRFVTPLD